MRGNTNLLNGLNVSTIFSLARLHVYMPICFFSTIVGLHIAGNSDGLVRLLTIGLANTFALVATFAFNDAEDAPDDILARTTRNVIALGKVSKGTGYFVAAVAGAISLSLSIIAGVTVCLIILAILIAAFLYSWRPFRIKAMPFWDVFIHAIVGGLIFLSSAWSSHEGVLWGNRVLPVSLIFASGTVLALLNHQLYEYEDDLGANIKTTVIVLGKRKTYWIVGFIFFLLSSLIINEYRSGVFPFISIVSFFVVAGSLILLSMVLPKKAADASKRMVPWATNAGVASAILTWYIA
ncbi:MAG: UbiA family prenyltransferase [Candidatus Scalinduaceae bacterium]